MAAFKWIVLLLACNLVGLFGGKSATAAPLYDSKESDNSDVLDDTSVGVEDGIMSRTHEKDTLSEGISDTETAEKGDGHISNDEGQEAGKDDAPKSQNVSDEEERGKENKSSNDNEHRALDNTLTEDEDKNIPIPESGKEDAGETSGKLEEEEEEEEEEEDDDETEEEGEVEAKENEKEEEKEEEEEEEEENEAEEGVQKNEETGHVGTEGDDDEADSSSTGLNQGSSASSEQTTDDDDGDDDIKSGEFTEAPDSEMIRGFHDNNKSPVSESRMAPLKEGGGDDYGDRGTVANSPDNNESDSAVLPSGEVSVGDRSEAVMENAEASHETTDKDHSAVNENVDRDSENRSHGDSNGHEGDEHDISQGGDSDYEAPDNKHGMLDSLPEDNTEDQNSSVEGNDSEVAESSSQETNKEDDDSDTPKEDYSGTDTTDDTPRISDTSSEVGEEGQNHDVEGNGQLGGSNVKPVTETVPGARSYKPLPTVPSSDSITLNDEKSTNGNYSTRKLDVLETMDISHKLDNESDVTANATGNHGEGEDTGSGTLVESIVTKSVSGSENNTHVFGTQGHKGDVRQGAADDGINEPGLGSQTGDSASSGSIGSYIVLGVIMAIIVVLLGYSMLKGRGRREQNAKSEDFGTEMSDVKKSLLPQYEFKDDIQPNTHVEEDKSNAKLLPDAQCTGDNAQSGETGVAVQDGVHSQKELGGADDSHTKEKTDFDKSSPDPKGTGDNVQSGKTGVAVQNGVNSQKELGGADDSHTKEKIDFDKIGTQLERTNSPANTLKPQDQNSNNLSKQAVTPKKQETTGDQSTCHQIPTTPSHQNANNNVKVVSKAVVEQAPVQTHGGYVCGNSGYSVAAPGQAQQYYVAAPGQAQQYYVAAPGQAQQYYVAAPGQVQQHYVPQPVQRVTVQQGYIAAQPTCATSETKYVFFK